MIAEGIKTQQQNKKCAREAEHNKKQWLTGMETQYEAGQFPFLSGDLESFQLSKSQQKKSPEI